MPIFQFPGLGFTRKSRMASLRSIPMLMVLPSSAELSICRFNSIGVGWTRFCTRTSRSPGLIPAFSAGPLGSTQLMVQAYSLPLAMKKVAAMARAVMAMSTLAAEPARVMAACRRQGCML